MTTRKELFNSMLDFYSYRGTFAKLTKNIKLEDQMNR